MISLGTGGFDPVNDFGTFASAIGLVADTLSFGFGVAAQDPPDSNYQSVFVPQEIVGPALDPQGVSSDFAQALTNTASDLDQAILDLNALGVTANRYGSAIDASDNISASIQYLAFHQYLGAYKTMASSASLSLSQMANILHADGIAQQLPTADSLSQAQNNLQTQGASIPGLYSYFETEGFTDPQIRAMIQEAATSTPVLPTESIGQSLVNLSNELLSASASQSATTTSISSSTNPAIANDAITFSATVRSPGANPTGTVTFFNGITLLGMATISSGLATLTISTLPVGTDNITAVYNGDVNSLASTSSTLGQTVNPLQNLSAILAGPVHSSVISTTTLKLKEKLTLTAGSATVSGTAGWSILLSPDETNGSSVFTLASATTKLKLNADKRRNFNVKLPKSIPASVAPGIYHILLRLTDTFGAVATLDSGQTIEVVTPIIDLTGSFVKVPLSVKAGKKASVTFLVTNTSAANVPATGLLLYDVDTSFDQQLSNAIFLEEGHRRINLKPGKSTRITLTAKINTATFLVVTLDPGNIVFGNDTDQNNNSFATNEIAVL